MDREPEVILQEMEATRAGLAEKLDTLEQQVTDTVQGAKNAVTDTVENVKEAVQETVGTVKDTVQGTVTSIKETFDLQLQVERHPWGMFGGSVAAGFLAAYLLDRSEAPRSSGMSMPALATSHGNGRHTEQDRSQGTAPSVGSALMASLGPEIGQLKGLAIGVLMGVARELIGKNIPKVIEPQISDVMERITAKLGGEPVHGSILDSGQCERSTETTSAV